ncbi:ABC transporter ATP-binding protein [Mycoplasma sp. SG1]|uniref:ABC transporter ATP-binding protein n=1 Tax=Mycoplasma sp. SG1 TaxID=2810348 RepID=UPI002024227A|nr:ABC transporter ATP-binding protein [Mycoplasma sp. SG1]URM53079.1 ABC transporter ATP-binding protein [Mycoplasma sp. SG1]
MMNIENVDKDTVLVVENLTKQFPLFRLDNISFRVNKAESIGIIGPNGSGKTTLINTIIKVYKPTSGKAYFPRIKRKNFFKHVSVQFQETSLTPNLLVRDVLRVFAYRFKTDWKIVLQLCQEFNVLHKLSSMAEGLSGGEKQKIGLIIALMNDPDILFLDEITSNVDPLARKDILKKLIQKQNDGKVLIIISHYLEELARLCNRFILLYSGKKIFDGTFEQLRQTFSPDDLNASLEDIYEKVYR